MTVEQQEIYRGELLQRWEDLAPLECDERVGGYWSLKGGWLIDQGMDSGDRAILLAALIENIRARRWHYTVESDETEPGVEPYSAWHNGYVMRDNKTFCYQAAEPCDALLAAYVEAIQSEAR